MTVRPELLLPAALSLATATLYGYVAYLVLQRAPPGDARLANTLFGVWWIALGGVSLLTGLYYLPASLGVRDLALTIAALNLLYFLIIVALWGLMYYLVYLYTGSRRTFWPVTAFYGVLFLLALYLVAWLQPIGLIEEPYSLRVEFARELEGIPRLVFSLSISLPVLAAALGYGSLFFRVQGRSRKFRVALVSGSFILWFGWSFVSGLTRLAQRYEGSLALEVLNRSIALLVPVLIVVAYRPPAWVRRRFGVTPTA